MVMPKIVDNYLSRVKWSKVTKRIRIGYKRYINNGDISHTYLPLINQTYETQKSVPQWNPRV